jgi:FAD/FMN-containing dehydrogenase
VTSGAYVGFLGDEGEARIREAYPATTLDRLTEIKRRYDPENLFRLNQNIPPAGL